MVPLVIFKKPVFVLRFIGFGWDRGVTFLHLTNIGVVFRFVKRAMLIAQECLHYFII